MKNQRRKQVFATLLIPIHVFTICGCSVTDSVTLPGNQIPVGSNFTIASAILKDGHVIEFESNSGMYVEKEKDGKSYRAIVGTTAGKSVEVEPEKVLEVRFERTRSSGAGSFALGVLVGMPMGVGILILAFSGSR
jgi:hypothetical protein